MRRFEAHQVNALLLDQARYIRRGIAYGVTALVAGVAVGIFGPPHWLVLPLAITGVVFGVISIALGFLMLARMPDLAQAARGSEWLDYESRTRPMMQVTARRVLPVNVHGILSAAEWACVRDRVRVNEYAISRRLIRPCGLSNEQYRALRAELIRCGVLPETGNDITAAGRAVFSPAPGGDTRDTGRPRTDDGV